MTESYDGEDSRRSFIKKGALASGGLALGISGAGSAAAQADNETQSGTGSEEGSAGVETGEEALIDSDEYREDAQFRVASPVIDETPAFEGFTFGEYDTRAIEYVNTGERVLFYPRQDVEVQQGEVYRFLGHPTLFQVNLRSLGVFRVGFEPVPAAESLFDDDGTDDWEPGEDFELTAGGGKALVTPDQFFSNALFRVTSDVVDWSPRENVQGSDIFSEYNTRIGEYLGAGDQFTFYPAHAAEVEQGGIYLMQKEFDVTDPEGDLITVTFDRVDESTVDERLL